MALSDSATTATIPASFQIPIAEKLSKSNYQLWRAQILPPIRAVQLDGLLTGADETPAKTIQVKTGDTTTEQPNPEYARWVSRDQALLGYLLSSLTREVLMGVTTLNTSAEVWSSLEGMFSTRTRARSVNTRIALATTRKAASTMAEFYSKMKSYADEMASSGQRLGDEEFVAYVLTGLDEEIYNSLVSSIVTRVEPISPSELFAQMLSYEQRLDKQSGGNSFASSANAAARGRGAPWNHGGGSSRGRGRSRGSGRGSPSGGSRGGYTNNINYRRNPDSSSDASNVQNRPRCQVCLKIGHTVVACWYRFDEAYVPDDRVAAMTTSSSTDPNWYLDSGATDHLTGELEKLTMHERYNGNDQIRAANGAGMDITRIGQSVIPTSTRPLHLNQVLHVPLAHKQLVSIHRFTLDNNTFIEFHPYFFLIKDQVTKRVLLRGPCRGGLYPLPPLSASIQKHILSAIKPSSQR
jgi:hypothetical protein